MMERCYAAQRDRPRPGKTLRRYRDVNTAPLRAACTTPSVDELTTLRSLLRRLRQGFVAIRNASGTSVKNRGGVSEARSAPVGI
jgi:hypothetical protein